MKSFNIDNQLKKIIKFSSVTTPKISRRPGRLPTPGFNNISFKMFKNIGIGLPNTNRILNNYGLKSFGGKNDLDGDGILNRKDCQPRNTMRQDFSLKAGVPIVDYPESYGYKKKTVYMSPNDYMQKAYASHGYTESGFANVEEYEKGNIFPGNLKRIKEGLQQKEQVVPTPWLETKQGRLVEQEGRHRAVAARELGYKTIPVHIIETEPVNNLMEDDDDDGVNNMMDCKPNNPNKQGPGDMPPQSLFYAGNQSPSQYLQQHGKVYGFSDLRFAVSWAKKFNYPFLYQYITNNYDLDKRQYVRDSIIGKEMSDNEFIAYNVLNEALLNDKTQII